MSQATEKRGMLKESCRQILASVAIVSLIAAFFTAARIAGNQETLRNVDPLNQSALQHLKEAAARHPQDQTLKDAFRDVDTDARRTFYRAKAFGRRGAFILAGACIVFLLSIQILATLLKRPPRPGTTADEADPTNSLVRTGLLAGGVTAVVFALALGRATQVAETEADDSISPSTVDASNSTQAVPAFDDHPGQWVGFRGQGGCGVADVDEPPTVWDGPSGQGVLWKIAPPKPGFSSPVIYAGKLFITGADDTAREVYCYDAATGDFLWQAGAADIVGSPAKLPDVSDDTGFAAASAACDGQNVYAIFATGDVLCVDLEGNRLWARNIGLPDNPYGHSSSLVVHQGKVLVQYDHFASAQFIALDARTGSTVWEKKRDVSASWASPILVRTPDHVVALLNAEPFAQAFDADSGDLLWSTECMGGEVGPSPAYDSGMAFFTTDYATLAAISVQGDNAGSIVWQTDEELPDVASPVADAGLLFVATSIGVVSCYDVRDGTLQWREEMPEGCYSSPLVAGGAVYFTDREGTTRLYKVAREATSVGSNDLGEAVVATPAFWGNKLYLRGVKNLYCLGK